MENQNDHVDQKQAVPVHDPVPVNDPVPVIDPVPVAEELPALEQLSIAEPVPVPLVEQLPVVVNEPVPVVEQLPVVANEPVLVVEELPVVVQQLPVVGQLPALQLLGPPAVQQLPFFGPHPIIELFARNSLRCFHVASVPRRPDIMRLKNPRRLELLADIIIQNDVWQVVHPLHNRFEVRDDVILLVIVAGVDQDLGERVEFVKKNRGIRMCGELSVIFINIASLHHGQVDWNYRYHSHPRVYKNKFAGISFHAENRECNPVWKLRFSSLRSTFTA